MVRRLPVGLCTCDRDGNLVQYNDKAAQLWGRRPGAGEPLNYFGAPGEMPVRGVLLQVDRPDGSRIGIEANLDPVLDANGGVTGGVVTFWHVADLDDELQVADEDGASGRAVDAGMHLAAIVESSADAIVSKNLNSIITTWNAAAERLFGYTADEAIGRSVVMLIPEGSQHEETEIIAKIRRGERVGTYETVRRHKDGHLIPVSLTISPVRDATGRIVGASKIARDITGHKESERRIRLLMREVNHRVKNQYAVILAMIRETGKRSKGPAEFERQVRDRIMALSESHDLLVNADWKGATVSDLLSAQVRPFVDPDRLSVAGPSLLLQPNALQYLGIAFHELATNAAKYGALSNRHGKVAVDWAILTEPDGAKRFELTWRESGGPAGEKAGRAGFGTVVLLRVAPQAISGTGEVVYDDTGLIWRLQAPLESVAVSEDAAG